MDCTRDICQKPKTALRVIRTGEPFRRIASLFCISSALVGAAFENVSELTVRPYDRISFIDFRYARLPTGPEQRQSEDFDPRDHREPKYPIKLWMAYFNLIRSSFGAGVLGFPLAVSQIGIVFGSILAFGTGLLIMYTHLMLLNALNEISRRLKIPYIPYRYGFRIALLHGPNFLHCIGRRGPTIIATFMILSQVGICTVFVHFTSDSLRDMMDWESTRSAIVILLVPYLLLEYFMKNLKIVSYISMLGNFLNAGGLALIFYHIFLDPQKDFMYVKFGALPMLFAFGTYLFNFSAVGVVLSVDKALPKPSVMVKKCGVLTIGMIVPTIIATIFGAVGYWSFGVMDENVIRALPYDDDTSMVSIGLYMIAVAFAYPIQCYPAIQIIIEIFKNYSSLYEPEEKTLKLVEGIARPAFVILTFIIGYLAPFQAPFVAFVGNLCTTMLALVFPAMMELCIMYPGPYGKFKFYLIKDSLIILLGMVSWIFGVVFGVYLIYIRVVASKTPSESNIFGFY